MRPMKRNSLVIFILCLALFPAVVLAGGYQVVRVVDGDTIVIDYQGKQEKVRLLRVNTPESVHPDKKQNIPMGKTASEYTKKRLAGESVDLKYEGDRRDRYGRLLAYIFVGGTNFNIELLRQGLSPYYTAYGPSVRYDNKFREAERQARKQGLGIWGDPELTQKYLRLKSKWGQEKPHSEIGPPTEAPVSKVVPSPQPMAKPVQWAYVASKNSKVFHRPECHLVRNIKADNLIGFETRQEAINSGRTPCKSCAP